VRPRHGAEPDGNGGAHRDRPRALGSDRRRHRSTFAEGQSQERFEGPMKTCFATCCVLATLAPVAAGAQPAPEAAERLALDAAVRMAVTHNRQLQTAN